MFQQCIVILSILFCCSSCTKPSPRPPMVVMPPVTDTTRADTTLATDTAGNAARPKTFLALGDSYTIGQSVPEQSRFPVQTVAKLNALNVLFEQPEIIAQTGWTTGSLLNALNNQPPTRSAYDIVTLLIGVNNQYQGRSINEYSDQFTQLLQRAIQLAGSARRVIVLSIPDYSVTPFANGLNTAQIASEIDAFNNVNRNIARQFDVNYLDITGYTREAATNPALLAIDRLHPSGMEYERWAGLLVPVIRSVIQ